MTKNFSIQLGIVACSALLFSCPAHAQPSVSVGISVPLPSVEIHVESDFYEPLAPQGEWVVVGSYGRCWRPSHVEHDWRPYCNGSWQRTDAGWYWVSDEPWAWATYHYGRWDYTDQYGWYWVPQTQWAPAWVSWHEGGGYVGWAPLQPSVTISVNGFVGFNESRISPRAFVFVEQRRFLDPIRPTTVVINNTTIINKTKTVTNTKIVNNTVINEGPAPAVIEKASGRKVQAMPVQELRHKTEAAVASTPRTPGSANGKKAQAPAAGETAEPREKKNSAARDPSPNEKPAPAPQPDAVAPAVKNHEPQNEKHNPAPTAPDLKPEPRPEGNHPPAMKEPSQPNAERHIENPQKPAPPANKKAPRPNGERPAPNENGAGPGDKERQNEPK